MSRIRGQHKYNLLYLYSSIVLIHISIQFSIINASFVSYPRKNVLSTFTRNKFYARDQYSAMLKATPDSENTKDTINNLELTNNDEEVDKNAVKVGDVIFAKIDIPTLKIYRDVGYDIVDIYHQGLNEETGRIDKLKVPNINIIPQRGYKLYLNLYSPKYHRDNIGSSIVDKAVVVTPEEVGLTTVQEEITNSLWLALPGLFWIVLCITFINNYNDRYGGNFMDALLGR